LTSKPTSGTEAAHFSSMITHALSKHRLCGKHILTSNAVQHNVYSQKFTSCK